MRPDKGSLLDTHVLLWVLADAPFLGSRFRHRVNSSAPVYFSPLSLVEIAIKAQKGYLSSHDDLGLHLTRIGFRPLSLDTESAHAVTRFPGLEGHDPFDRMLVAQAAAHSLCFYTSDKKIAELDLGFVKNPKI